MLKLNFENIFPSKSLKLKTVDSYRYANINWVTNGISISSRKGELHSLAKPSEDNLFEFS